MSLRDKTAKGLAWSFASQGGRQLSQFIVTIILARMLNPDDFGLMGIATVFIGFLSIFADIGLGNALIQKQSMNENHLSSSFWLNVLIGILLCGLFYLCAPIIADFYKSPELTPILRVLSLNFVFVSLGIVQTSIVTKDLNFKALTIRDLTAVLISGIVGVGMAASHFGVWSLVFQTLVLSLLNLIGIWSISPWRPRILFSMEAIKELTGTSLYMSASNTVIYFSRNIDYLLIGKFLGTEALGYYTLAYKLMLYPLQNISWALGRVLFPAFSKIQSNGGKVRANYLKIIKLISLSTFPIMLSLFIIARELIIALYGVRWATTADLIRVLCFCGMFQSISTMSGTLLMSQGKVATQFKLALFGAVFATICIGFGLNYGLTGVVWMYLFYTVIMFVVLVAKISSIIRTSAYVFTLPILDSLLINIAVFSPLFFIQSYLHIQNIAILLILLSLFFVIYLFLIRDRLREIGIQIGGKRPFIYLASAQ